MARVTITAPGILKGVNTLPKELTQDIAESAERRLRRRVKYRADKHWNNLLDQVGQKLALGGISAQYDKASRARFPLHFQYVNNRAGRLLTAPWPPLSEKYRATMMTKQFWHETGTLERLYHTDTGSKRGKVKIIKTAAVRSHKKGRVSTAYEMIFPVLNHNLEKMMVTPFTTGTVPRMLGRPAGFNRGTLDRAYYPEKERQFVRDLSVLLGKDMRRELRKVK